MEWRKTDPRIYLYDCNRSFAEIVVYVRTDHRELFKADVYGETWTIWGEDPDGSFKLCDVDEDWKEGYSWIELPCD